MHDSATARSLAGGKRAIAARVRDHFPWRHAASIAGHPSFSVLARSGEMLALALAYYLAARLGLQLQFAGSQATPVWPPSGLALAAMLLLDYRASGGIFLGALCANLVDFHVKAGGSELIQVGGFLMHLGRHPDHIVISVLIAAGNTLEAAAGRYMIGRFGDNTDLLRSIFSAMGFCAVTPLACAISSTIGVASLIAGGVLPAALFSTVWFTWWLGDITGILIVTPFLLAVWGLRGRRFEASSFFTSALVLFVLFLVNGMAFNGWIESRLIFRPYWLFPLLLFITFRFGTETATASIVITSAMAVLGTISGRSTFIRADQNESLIVLQGFVSVISVTVLFLNAAISERRRALEELEQRVHERTAQLEAANLRLREKNQELEDFATIASHDLQEPLRNISTFGQLLAAEKREQLDDDAKQYLHFMVDGANRMRQLIQALLTYSRAASAPTEEEAIDLARLVPAVVEDLAPSIGELGAKIVVADLPRVVGDDIQMRQLFQNLIGNALKYHAKERSPEVRIDAAPSADGRFSIVTIADNGIGFDPKYQQDIFKPFKRLHGRAERPGSGMGLAICRKIVERHGGSISAEGRPGQGAIFKLRIPAFAGESIAA